MKRFQYFDVVIAIFVACLIISNLAATKLINIGGFILDGGAVLFPLVYILGDILTEVYGFKYARRAIWTGFAAILLALLAFTIVRYLPAAPEYRDQLAYEAVLGFFPRIVLASLVAYLVGEFMNSYVLAKLKIKTKGKKLWLRLIGSTFVGEFFDTVIFCLIAFSGVIGGVDMLNYILVGWIFKTIVEVLLLPVTYRVIKFLKQKEDIDIYDRRTKFNPFSASLKN